MAGYYERQQERAARYLATVPPPTEEWRSQMMEKCAKDPQALFRDPPVKIKDPLPEFQKTEGFNEAVREWRKSLKIMGVKFTSDEQAARAYLRSPASEGWQIGKELGDATQELVDLAGEAIEILKNPETTADERKEAQEGLQLILKQVFSVPDVLASAVGMDPKEFKKEFDFEDLPNANEIQHQLLVNQVLAAYGPKSSPKPS